MAQDMLSIEEKSVRASVRDKLPTSGKVYVACKMPNGLILRLQQPRTKMVPGRFGMTEETISEFVGAHVILSGSRAPGAEHGFGITEVDAPFFAKWWDQNDGLPHVSLGLLFAERDRASLSARIKNRRELRSNFEPIDPEDVPNISADKVDGGVRLAGTL